MVDTNTLYYGDNLDILRHSIATPSRNCLVRREVGQ
jgi:hypothetical protein